MGTGFPDSFEDATECLSTLISAGKPLQICSLLLLI